MNHHDRQLIRQLVSIEQKKRYFREQKLSMLGKKNAPPVAKRRKGTSKFRGVSWDPRRKKWITYIRADQKTFFVGRFDDEEEAARAYDHMARRLLGERATTNF